MNTRTNLDQELLDLLSNLKQDESVNPSVVYKQNTKVRLMNLIADEEKIIERKSSFVFIRSPKFAFRLAGVFLIIFIFISTGTILAAQSANPKNTLYPVKLASENIALKLSPTPFKANVAVEIAKRRGSEVTVGKKSENNSEIQQGIEKYKESINQAKIFVPSSNTRLHTELEHEENNLNELTRQYEDFEKTDNNTNNEERVKGTSDFKPQTLNQNTQLKSDENKALESPKPTETSTSQSIERTINETRESIEHEIQNAFSPQTSEERK